MNELCARLVGRYFAAALKAAEGSEVDDAKATRAAEDLGGAADGRVQTLARWIRFYKVHRVKWIAEDDDVDQTFAEVVARCAIGVFDGWHNHQPDVPDAYAELRNAIGDLYKGNCGKDRAFRSLTAKVLWCRYPDTVPIYDLFASEAITFLAKVYKALELPGSYEWGKEEDSYDNKRGYVDWKTADSATRDIWWYTDFHRSHELLFERFRPRIEEHLANHPDSPSAFRVFDKILWLFGNHDLDYSLMHVPGAARNQ